MEYADDDVQQRKRRRRSIRNLRRQSGIMPFCLNEEPPVEEERRDAEDPYGSLWLDPEEPVKIKRRRRSSLLVVVPKFNNVLQDNIGDTSRANKGSKEADNQTVLIQNFNESKYAVVGMNNISADFNESNYAVVGLENISAEHENYLGKSVTEANENYSDNLDCKETVHKQVKPASIIYSKTDNETGVVFNLMTPQIDEGVPKKRQHLLDNETFPVCTPPDMLDELFVTGPQSMSPEFPVSPSDLIYIGHHDDSYTNYLPADHRAQQQCEISDAAFTTNSEKISTCTQSNEFGALIMEAGTDVVCNVDFSVNATRLQTSASYTENAEFPLSDKENNNLTQEGISSNSPGVLSSCKAFAGKVVDLVKTSPSYLTKILQDSKSKNAESPSVKQNSKSRSVSADHVDKSYSNVKIALASELGRSLENVVEDSEQKVQVFSVPGIAKPDEASEKVGKIKIDQIIDIEENKQEIVSDAVATGRKQKRQKSSQVFFDTFNAVRSEFNKSILLDEIDKCGEGALMENTSKSIHSQANANIEKMLLETVDLNEDESVLAYEDIDQAVQTRSKQLTVENGNGFPGKKYNVETDTADLDSAFKETHNLTSDKQQSLNLGKRRKVDEVRKEKIGQNKHKSSVIIERKQRKSSLSGSFTEIGDYTRYNDKIVSRSQCEQETILSSSGEGPGNSSTCSLATADPTDNTASVVTDFSKLELNSLPQPMKPTKERANLKKDRKRRRSNNFYFPSVYNDSEETLDDMKGNIEQSKLSDFVNETSRAINTNSVATDILLVSIKDPDSIEEVQADYVSIGQESHKAQTLKTSFAPEKKLNNETIATRNDGDKENMTENSAEGEIIVSSVERKGNCIDNLVPQADEEPVPRRKRRRSADAAALKIRLCAGDIDISQEEQNTGPTTPVQQNRRRKKSPEIPLEDIYKNKNYKKPQGKTWETIFESPKVEDQLFSKRRVHTTIDFEKTTQAKLKRRSQKAVKNGWDSKKRKRKSLAEETFHMKISGVFTELDKLEDESLSDKIKQTLAY